MRYILVDRILEVSLGRWARGCKNVTQTDEIFDQHFPDLPVMPGCMMLEALAQLSGLLASASRDFQAMPMLLIVERAKFRRLVRPGDQLLLDTTLSILTEDAARFETRASLVGSSGTGAPERPRVAAEAILTLGLTPVSPARGAAIRRKFELLRGVPYEGLVRG